jgi:hypothetical protein
VSEHWPIFRQGIERNLDRNHGALMAANFSIVVSNGDGSTTTYTIAIPQTGTAATDQTGDVQWLMMDVSRRGFFDSSGVFHPSHRIVSIAAQ